MEFFGALFKKFAGESEEVVLARLAKCNKKRDFIINLQSAEKYCSIKRHLKNSADSSSWKLEILSQEGSPDCISTQDKDALSMTTELFNPSCYYNWNIWGKKPGTAFVMARHFEGDKLLEEQKIKIEVQ